MCYCTRDSITDFWNVHRFSDRELLQLTEVVLATPMIQVSVERVFSGLKYVLYDQHSNLSADIIEDLCFIRINAIIKNH